MRRFLLVSVGLLFAGCGSPETGSNDALAPAATSPAANANDAEPDHKSEAPSRPSLPEVGTRAPDFELASVSGERVELSQACGQRPTVLIFGSLS